MLWATPPTARECHGFGTKRTSVAIGLMEEGEVTADVFGLLTTAPNAEVAKIHPKAMPVILTTNDECDLWMSGDWETASKLQRPLPNGSLKIVASGEKENLG